jgi:hypothetical protein
MPSSLRHTWAWRTLWSGGTMRTSRATGRRSWAWSAMAGDFKVRFDMRETVSFLPDHTLLEPKVLGGHESVRVVVDAGDVIYL